jgi:hypothetical protein
LIIKQLRRRNILNDQKDIEKLNLDALESFNQKSQESNSVKPNLHTYSDQNHVNYYNRDAPIGVGAWLILIIVNGLLSIIPTVGPFITLIITFILAFSNSVNKNLQNLARAILILSLIVLIIVFIFYDSFIKYI